MRAEASGALDCADPCALPESVREIADAIGVQDALRLVAHWPRQRGRLSVYVPKRLRPGHRLVAILGHATASRLVDAFGGETVSPAGCAALRMRWRNQQIEGMRDAGMPCREIAARLGVSLRLVQIVCARR